MGALQAEKEPRTSSLLSLGCIEEYEASGNASLNVISSMAGGRREGGIDK